MAKRESRVYNHENQIDKQTNKQTKIGFLECLEILSDLINVVTSCVINIVILIFHGVNKIYEITAEIHFHSPMHLKCVSLFNTLTTQKSQNYRDLSVYN